MHARILAMLALAATVTVVLMGLDFYGFVHAPLGIAKEGLRHDIAPGTTLAGLARDLEAAGALDRPRYFVLLGRWRKLQGSLKAGEYQFAQGTTPWLLLDQVTQGRVVQHSFTIVEGWTFRQLMQALWANDYVVKTLDGVSETAVMNLLGRPGQHPEGLFYPDTYFITRGAKDIAVLRRAMRAMEERLAVEWEQRDPRVPYENAYQALILASIVEKESARPEERHAIAGVFVRRLQQGIPLAADPTVIYGLGESFDGNLTRADLKRDTPYNTYLHLGLPPTPIAMPGGAAIHAAMHPGRGRTLYFVARGDGTHQFSESLKEHNRAVRRYQLGDQVR